MKIISAIFPAPPITTGPGKLYVAIAAVGPDIDKV